MTTWANLDLPMPAAAAAPRAMTVSQLNSRASSLLDTQLGVVTVEGEISGFAAHSSGHWYFTLKDERSQITAACFKGQQRGDFVPQSGDQVVCRGRVSIYGPRGAYQLVVTEITRAGQGVLQQRFEALKAKLRDEGLFAAERKRQLPRFPARIALITSADGAAVRDFLKVASSRNPALDALVLSTTVQGPGSVERVTAAIRFVSREAVRLGISMLVVTRGGGSLEDLWTFNEESVVRALAACTVPTVSAIGHEIDFTLCDFAADVRAPTPTAAAQLVVPDMLVASAQLKQSVIDLQRALQRRVEHSRHRLLKLERGLGDPSTRVLVYRQRLDQSVAAAERALLDDLAARRERLQALQRRLERAHPARHLAEHRAQIVQHLSRLEQHVHAQLADARERFATAAAQLDALSPLAVLSRGYSLTRRLDDGRVVRSPADTPPGTRLTVRLSEGALVAISQQESPNE